MGEVRLRAWINSLDGVEVARTENDVVAREFEDLTALGQTDEALRIRAAILAQHDAPARADRDVVRPVDVRGGA